MPKRLVPAIFLIVVMLASITAMSACTSEPPKPEPEYAATITESILQAINEDNYAQLSEHFTEEMKSAMPETAFQEAEAMIKDRVGDYVSKVFWKTEEQSPYTVVDYKAKFTLEPADVIVRFAFEEVNGEIYVSGLWFDSPKLRGE